MNMEHLNCILVCAYYIENTNYQQQALEIYDLSYNLIKSTSESLLSQVSINNNGLLIGLSQDLGSPIPPGEGLLTNIEWNGDQINNLSGEINTESDAVIEKSSHLMHKTPRVAKLVGGCVPAGLLPQLLPQPDL